MDLARSTALVALALALIPVPGAHAQDVATDADLVDGRVHYVAACARCHGVRGGGGEGPSLARSTLPRAPNETALLRIISNGIPGSAMAGSWWLSQNEQRQVAAYVRSLAPSDADEAEMLTGDPSRGRQVYEDRRCMRCHTIGGFGTNRGPDLTTLGLRRGAEYLRQALIEPADAFPRGQTEVPDGFADYLMVRVVDADGNAHRGMRMNEDTYSIQIKDGRGRIHSFYKPDLQALEKQFDTSLMQSYRDRLTEEELEDLVAYLSTLQGDLRGIS